MQFNIETERETNGRWIAEIPEIPGALAYERTERQAKAKAYALALRAIADDVEKYKRVPQFDQHWLYIGMSAWPSTRTRIVFNACQTAAPRIQVSQLHLAVS